MCIKRTYCVLEWGSRGREFKSLHPDQWRFWIVDSEPFLLRARQFCRNKSKFSSESGFYLIFFSKTVDIFNFACYTISELRETFPMEATMLTFHSHAGSEVARIGEWSQIWREAIPLYCSELTDQHFVCISRINVFIQNWDLSLFDHRRQSFCLLESNGRCRPRKEAQ